MRMDLGDWWFTSRTVKPRDRRNIVSMRTGITEIDKRIMGLNKKDVSVFSGFRSAGKSTILTQLALQSAHDGRKVALFSGELEEDRVFEWTYLICAGRTYTIPTSYENWFEIDPRNIEMMRDWLAQKVFLYNNNYGNEEETLFFMLNDVMKKGVDIIILDNLMSIDIGGNDTNKNAKQKDFIWKIKNFAKANNVHIVLVAHPKKTVSGVLRIDDISGTADLTNAADNVFLLHRTTFDFKRNAKALFRWSDEEPILQYDNVIEIAKNRDLGRVDDWIGMYFDLASKQMSCDGKEICYGWRND